MEWAAHEILVNAVAPTFIETELTREFLADPEFRQYALANRIQMAMAAEAIAMIEEGLTTPAEVDRIVKSSFGFRLGAYGPFEIIDQAGADTYLSVFEYLAEKLGKTYLKPPELLKRQVKAGRLGLKSSGGFYEYGPGAADVMRRDRDRKFHARLELVRKEWEQE